MPQGVSRRIFHGAVVSSELVVGAFFDAVAIGNDVLELRPLGRRGLMLHRDEVEAIEFERQWAPPFWVRTVIRFRLRGGVYAPKVVMALRTGAIRAALRDDGWPVTHVQFGSTEPRTERPMRELRGRDS